MLRKFLGVVCIGAIFGSFANGEWNICQINDEPCITIDMGDGRNDGVDRIYVGKVNRVEEWSYVGGNWVCDTIASSGSKHIALGKGRDDDTTRVYWWDLGVFRILEATFTGAIWRIDTVDEVRMKFTFGEGRNDGITRIYTCGGGSVTEATWNGFGWDTLIVGEAQFTDRFIVGDGRNDGINRIYISKHEPFVDILGEYVWNGINWDWELIDTTGVPHSICIGQCKGDTINRVYIDGGSIREYTYNSGWINSSTIPSTGMWLRIGDVRNDGKDRIYFPKEQHDEVREASWTGSGWDVETIDAITAASVCIGDGRNDDTVRLYTVESSDLGVSTKGLYEATYFEVAVEEKRNIVVHKLGQNEPNPSISFTRISFSIPRAGHVKLDLYDIVGRRVKSLINEYLEKGSHSVELSELKAGTYFAVLKHGGIRISEKVVVF